MSVLDRFSLAGKRALVTGASRGLGAAMAVALAEAGADVVCASSKPDGAAETAKAIRALGRQAWTVAGDLASRADRDALVAATERSRRRDRHPRQQRRHDRSASGRRLSRPRTGIACCARTSTPCSSSASSSVAR